MNDSVAGEPDEHFEQIPSRKINEKQTQQRNWVKTKVNVIKINRIYRCLTVIAVIS